MKAVFVACMVLVLAQAQKAEAFSDTAKFELPAVEGGGGGRFFTGSPPDGYSCTVCHQGGQSPNVLVSGLPLDGFQPGTTYEIAVTFDQPELSHALALEFVTEAGVQAGTVAFPENAEADPAAHCAQDLTLSFAPYLMPVRGRTIVGLGDCGATALRFRFTPPNEPLVAFSLGIVTSNGQGDSAGDGARQITHVLRRFGERSPSAVGATCNVDWARSDTPRPSRWFILMLVMLALFRRRLRPTGVCGLLVATILLPGCARVAPYERGTLARRDMELGENADLTAGEEHAEAYREGSSGGGAAKGGGCGCN
jgi:hypothetical protein